MSSSRLLRLLLVAFAISAIRAADSCLQNEGQANECFLNDKEECRRANIYLGNKTKTKSGKPCQKWTVGHGVFYAKHSDQGFGDHYFCRGDEVGPGDPPWCYVATNDGDGKEWEFCFPTCGEQEEMVGPVCDFDQVDIFHDCIQEPMTEEKGRKLLYKKLACFQQAGCTAPSWSVVDAWENSRACRVEQFSQHQVCVLTACVKSLNPVMNPPGFKRQYTFQSFNLGCEKDGSCTELMNQQCQSDSGRISQVRICMAGVETNWTNFYSPLVGKCFMKMPPDCQKFQMGAGPKFCACVLKALSQKTPLQEQFDACDSATARPPDIGYMAYLQACTEPPPA